MSCLFNSLGRLLNVDPTRLRMQICDALDAKVPIISEIDTHEVLALTEGPRYTERMRSTSEWGGAIEIQVACTLYKIRVIVENRRDAGPAEKTHIEFLPSCNQNFERTAVIYWTGGHYEPVRIF